MSAWAPERADSRATATAQRVGWCMMRALTAAAAPRWRVCVVVVDSARELLGQESPEDVLIHRLGTETLVRAKYTWTFDGLVERGEGRGDDGG